MLCISIIVYNTQYIVLQYFDFIILILILVLLFLLLFFTYTSVLCGKTNVFTLRIITINKNTRPVVPVQPRALYCDMTFDTADVLREIATCLSGLKF